MPARNEAENLKRTLPALLRQGPSRSSSWTTSPRTAPPKRPSGGGKPPRLPPPPGRPPPPGWTGKNWACFQLAQEARGEVLVFTDADVLWEEGALGGLLEALEGKEMVSALPGRRWALGRAPWWPS